MQYPHGREPDIAIEEVHEKSAYLMISKERLIELVQNEAIRVSGFKRSNAIRFEIKFEDANEGSPPYKVGTKCSVRIIENQRMLP